MKRICREKMLDYLSLLLGAIIGFLGSIGFFFVQEWWYSRIAAKLLKTEISLILKSVEGIVFSLNETLDLIKGDSPIVDIPTPKLDTQFYEKSIEKISLFNTERISDIKTFYFLVGVYQHAIERAVLNKEDKHSTNEWIIKALNALTYAKDLGTKLTSKL